MQGKESHAHEENKGSALERGRLAYQPRKSGEKVLLERCCACTAIFLVYAIDPIDGLLAERNGGRKAWAEAGTRSRNAAQPRPRPVAGGSASVSRQSPMSKLSRPPWEVVSGWGGLLPITSPFSVSTHLFFFSFPSPPTGR
ncbi:hypothetical protein BHE74_00019612 [Ensete ventricosum]|nr:hypothetical protein GW17_00003013 [Ensete ventricosum]RWW72618.1 hypothetical protein BHE74_00019612 [Ensete ventricosum]RZR82131.1 hypothetical protein BHM03_00008499 [Ensete ventricosum]